MERRTTLKVLATFGVLVVPLVLLLAFAPPAQAGRDYYDILVRGPLFSFPLACHFVYFDFSLSAINK
jgi:hypothetical protein